jgi:hypothetical protein
MVGAAAATAAKIDAAAERSPRRPLVADPPEQLAGRAAEGRKRRWSMAALAALPVVLTWALPDWYISLPSGIDPWFYHGFFRHLDGYNTDMFPGTYYGTRLAWILPGHALFAVFAPDRAELILHVICYCAAAGAVYWIVREIADAGSALFSAITFGLFLPAARGLGDDYVAAGVVTYALLASALALAASRYRPWRALLFGSGFLTGAMFHSNIVSTFLVPTILVWIVPASLEIGAWKRAARMALVWGLGFATCTAALGLVSLQHGGRFLFFVPSFVWMWASMGTNPWNQKGFQWVYEVPWSLMPAATALACAAVCLRHERRAALDDGRVRALAAFGFIFGLFLVWDFVGSAAVLYWPFYASWLHPTAFIALGAAVIGTARRSGVDRLVLAGAVAALAVSLARPDLVPILFKAEGIAAVLAVMAAAGSVPGRAAAAVLGAAVIVHLNVWASATGFFSPHEPRLDVFQAVDGAVRQIEHHSPSNRPPRFLYDAKDPKLGLHYNAIAGVYLWGYSIVSSRYPAVNAEEAKLIPAGTLATIMSGEAYDAAVADRALAPHGLRVDIVAMEQVQTANGPLHLTFVRTLDRPK